MKTLLIFLAIVLIAAGWAVGLINIFSPGTVTVGLNLDVAATLFTGGCVLLGLAVVAGNLSAMTRRETDNVEVEDHAPAAPAESDLPDFMAPASAAAAGAAASVAAGASAFGDTANDTVEASADIVDDVMDDIKSDTRPVVDSAGSIFSSVTSTADEAVDKAEEVVSQAADKVEEVTEETVDKARDDLSSFFSKPADTSAAPEAAQPSASAADSDIKATSVIAEEAETEAETILEMPDASDDADTMIFSGSSPVKADEADTDITATDTTSTDTTTTTDAVLVDAPEVAAAEEGNSESAAEPAADAESEADSGPEVLPQEDELFVVEERVIRDRPARLLSDGTVEAETDEGWMRFENVEHVEEYLDAMRATA
ncbi:MAG: hypothetical protein ABJM26_04965 [Anderseniella sp.]